MSDSIEAVDGDGNLTFRLDGKDNFWRGGNLTFVEPQRPRVTISVADPVRIYAEDGRLLLRIGSDGSVDGAVEDMGEAARIFVERLRELVAQVAA